MKTWRVLPVVGLAACVCAVASADTIKKLAASRPGYYKAETTYPVLTPASPVSQAANRGVAAWARKGQRDFIAESRRAFRETGKPRFAYEYEADVKVVYRSPRLVSLRALPLYYTGGAHPNDNWVAFNYGLIDDKARKLKLADFFRPGSAYRKTVNAALMAKLRKDERASFVEDGTVKKLTPQMLESFVAAPDGLAFLFSRYDVGPSAAGSFEVKLTVSELGPDFKRAMILGRGR